MAMLTIEVPDEQNELLRQAAVRLGGELGARVSKQRLILRLIKDAADLERKKQEQVRGK